MDSDAPKYLHDAFLSYSRKDVAFAKALEGHLENFKTPNGLQIPEHNLAIFRDENDFTGADYYNSIESHLRQSAALIVICSPDAASSSYVDDEVRRFAKISPGNERKIVPILYRGVPNNEVKPSHEHESAFPPALCEALGMPVGINYLGFDLAKHKFNRGAYFNSWYALLANVCGVSRAEIEERDRLRQSRQRRFQAGVIGVVFAALLVALIVTLISRQQAVSERDLAQSGELSANALNAMSHDPQLGLLLSIEAATLSYSANHAISIEAQASLHRALLTQRERLRLNVNSGFAYSVAFSPDRRLLATADVSQIRLWDVVTGVPLATQFTGAGKCLSLAFSPDGTKLITGGGDKQARLWDVSSGRQLHVFSGHTEFIWSVAFSPDGNRLATASNDSTIKLWDVSSGKELRTLAGHKGFIDAVAFSHDGKLLATGGKDGTARIWDAESGNQLIVITEPEATDTVRGVAFSPDGRRLGVVNTASTSVEIWDVSTGRQLTTYQGHTASVMSIAYSPDGSQIATASLDRTARLWDTSSGKELAVFIGHTEAAICVAFSADGEHLATGAEDGTARIWETEQPNEFPSFVGHIASVNDIAFSPDGNRLASASSDGTARLWKTSTGQGLLTLRPGSVVSAVAFSPDGNKLATATSERDANVFNLTTGAKTLTLSGHTAALTSIAYSRDGRYLITGSQDKSARIWDAANGKMLFAMAAKTGAVESVALNRNGTKAALALYDDLGDSGRSTQLWNVGAGAPSINFDGDHVWVNQLQFSPDETRLATTGSTAPFLVKVWDSKSGAALVNLRGHTAAVLAVAFSPDGQTLASGGEDSTIRLWNLRDGRDSLSLPFSKAEVESLAFTPNGRQLAAAGNDGTVRLYAIDPMDLIMLSASRLTRTLNEEECQRYLHRNDCSAAVSSKLFAGKQSVQQGDTASAAKTLDGIWGRASTNASKLLISQLLMSQARERAETGNFAQAASTFRSALDLQSRSAGETGQETVSLTVMWQMRSVKRLESAGEFNAAIATLKQTIALDPANEEAYTDLANSLDKTNQPDKAVDAMQHAVNLRASASNLIKLADYLRVNKQYPEAEKQLASALSLEPKSEWAHRVLGLVYENTNKSDRALTEFNAALASKPTVYAYREIARVYEARNDFHRALENLQRAKAIDKTYSPLYEDAEEIYHEDLGDFQAAYHELSAGHKAIPDNTVIAEDLAEACLTAGRFQEAIDTVDQLIGSGGTSQELSVGAQVALRFVKTAAYLLDGRTREADSANADLNAFRKQLAPFKQTWDYAGTKKFLAESRMNESARSTLQTLLASIESSKPPNNNRPR